MIDFVDVAHKLNDIASTSSTSAKQALLVKYANVEGFKQVLSYIYDPYFTTGIKQAKLSAYGYTCEEPSVEYIMGYLRENNTGTMADVELANSFIEVYSFDAIAEWAATGLVTKDLQIGISVTTLNRVYGKSFIPRIGIMRGMMCPKEIAGKYIATEKIDGNRRLVFVYSDHVRVYTRSGRPDTGLVDIVEEAKRLPSGYVYDCEMIKDGIFSDCIALRQATASVANSGGIKKGVVLKCFDMLPIQEYSNGVSRMPAIVRKAVLATVMNDKASVDKLLDFALEEYGEGKANTIGQYVKMFSAVEDLKLFSSLPILGIVKSYDEAVNIAKPIWNQGYEGVMLAEINSPYEVSPNPRPTLLKIKDIVEFTCKVRTVNEGTNKYVGMLGSVTVEFKRKDKVYYVNVGSGFADYQRQLFWDDPDRIIGKYIEIEGQGVSKNKDGNYSINCPRFKRIVGDVD